MEQGILGHCFEVLRASLSPWWILPRFPKASTRTCAHPQLLHNDSPILYCGNFV
jgi:hypothetical protein